MTNHDKSSREPRMMSPANAPAMPLLTAMLFAGPGAAIAQTCNSHVDEAATGMEDGTSWQDAYTHLQDALDEANADPATDYVVCAATGVYRPDADKDGDHVDGDVTESFRFEADNVKLYGGYPPGGGTRDPEANPAVLSGDIDENDNANASGITPSADSIVGSNARHVVRLIGGDGTPITSNTRIEGVSITAGDSSFDAGGSIEGGGIQCSILGSGAECSPRIVDVIFQGNAAYSGGGVNFVIDDGAMASPRFDNVVFRNNSSANVGAGAHFQTGGPGAGAAPVFVNTLFSGNKLDEAYRGGAYDSSVLQPLFVNTVFVNNEDDVPIYNYQVTGADAAVNEPLFVNTIIWSNAAAITDNGATSTVNDSIVQGGWSGGGSGNLDQDPAFIDADGPDGIAGTADDEVRLQGVDSPGGASPAIDAGDNDALPADVTDLDGDGDTAEATPIDLYGNARIHAINSADVDLGVHEWRAFVAFASGFES